jgi:glycosyltransferase involved in cell wall biosynthesis
MFWLYVAHFYQHKNHVSLLKACAYLKSSGFSPWPLVLRGDRKDASDIVIQTISALDLHESVILLPRLDLSEMPALYSAAAALVFPSFYEGGGLPICEAMACGCPVVAASIAAVQEYSGGLASYFDPGDVVSIARSMKCVQEDESLRRKLAADGPSQAAKFDGKIAAHGILSVYEETMKRSKC